MHLIAAWEVRAGVIPGSPMPQYSKQFLYTSEDVDKDAEHANDFAYQTIFNQRQFQAMSYHLQMSSPSLNNWADLTFIWY